MKILLPIILLIFSSHCNSQKTNNIELISTVTDNYSTITDNLGVQIGIRNGSELRFYDEEEDKTFKEVTEIKLNLPNGTDEIILGGRLLTLRNGAKLRFYGYEREYGFIELPEKKFNLPNEADEIATAYGTGILCIRNGSELTFYKEEDYEFEKKEYTYKELTEMKFSLPNGADEIIMIGEALGVRNDSELRFYIYDSKNKKFKELPEMKFDLPNGTNEIIMTPTGLLGVRNGNELRFYNAKNNKFKEVPEMKFNLPKN